MISQNYTDREYGEQMMFRDSLQPDRRSDARLHHLALNSRVGNTTERRQPQHKKTNHKNYTKHQGREPTNETIPTLRRLFSIERQSH